MVHAVSKATDVIASDVTGRILHPWPSSVRGSSTEAPPQAPANTFGIVGIAAAGPLRIRR
jgi:hypothetical protein